MTDTGRRPGDPQKGTKPRGLERPRASKAARDQSGYVPPPAQRPRPSGTILGPQGPSGGWGEGASLGCLNGIAGALRTLGACPVLPGMPHPTPVCRAKEGVALPQRERQRNGIQRQALDEGVSTSASSSSCGSGKRLAIVAFLPFLGISARYDSQGRGKRMITRCGE